MYNTWSRFALMSIFGLSAFASLYFSQYQLATVSAFLFAFILWSHFKQGSVLMASKHFKNADYARTEEVLDEIANPDRLAKNRRGYYEFMRANIALQREDYEQAEYHFQIASRFPLGGKNDKAFVLIHLANLALRKKDAERAIAYIENAKELATTSRAKDIIKTIEKEAKNLAH